MSIHKSSSRSLRRTVSLTAAAASLAALGAAGLASPASALISKQVGAGHPGPVYFADEHWNATPVLQATAAARSMVTFSTGKMIVSPDPVAEEGPQFANIHYTLYKADGDNKYHVVAHKVSSDLELSDGGVNLSKAFAGSGPIATMRVGHADRFKITVRVDRFVGPDWQSSVVLEPDQSSELACGVNKCTVNAPGSRPGDGALPSNGAAFLVFG